MKNHRCVELWCSLDCSPYRAWLCARASTWTGFLASPAPVWPSLWHSIHLPDKYTRFGIGLVELGAGNCSTEFLIPVALRLIVNRVDFCALGGN